MPVTRVCYCNRQTMMRSVDFRDGTDQFEAADRAIETASKNIDEQLHRRFYPQDGTVFWDWPNQGGSGGGQYANPWRLWLDQFDCVVLTAVVTGGVTIPLNQVFLEPVNNPMDGRPFYEYLELDRSSSAAFGGNSVTPQHSVALTGTWGHGANADQVTALAASIGTSDTTLTVTDGSKVGVGDLLITGYGRGAAPYPAAAGYAGALGPFTGERILVTGQDFTSTSVAFTGPATASDADNVLAVPDGTKFAPGEVLQFDAEQCLVLGVSGNSLLLRRAWNGTVLAAHTSGTIYAFRLLSVTRGMYGTTAASASNGAAVYKHRVPSLIRDLNIAEAVNQVLQEGSGYARTIGSGADAHPAPGADLASKWEEAMVAHGRKARVRAV
jgi:hypothetical protein